MDETSAKLQNFHEYMNIKNLERFVSWDVTPCSPAKVNPTFRRNMPLPSPGSKKQEISKFANFFVLVSCLAYSSIMKMEDTCSSETSIDFQLTTRRYIPEARTLRISCKLSKESELNYNLMKNLYEAYKYSSIETLVMIISELSTKINGHASWHHITPWH
jgi:hypothetical protein